MIECLIFAALNVTNQISHTEMWEVSQLPASSHLDMHPYTVILSEGHLSTVMPSTFYRRKFLKRVIRYVCSIRKLYWQQIPYTRLRNKFTPYAKIEIILRQGCVFSYLTYTVRRSENLPEFIMASHNLNNIWRHYLDQVQKGNCIN